MWLSHAGKIKEDPHPEVQTGENEADKENQRSGVLWDECCGE